MYVSNVVLSVCLKHINFIIQMFSPESSKNIVACLLKARTVKPAETAVAKEQPSEYAHC
jgi:hypothetical protein